VRRATEAFRALAARPAFHGAVFVVLAVAIVFAHMGETHLANFDDCYYAQKAKEMVQGGRWLTPHFQGVPRFDNAPLFLWLMALSFTVFGITDWAAILFSALSGVAGVWLVRRVALRLGADAFTAWATAFILLTTQYFLKYARHAMFDVFLTLLFLVAIDRYLAWRAGGRLRDWAWIGFVAGCGVLTKSVLGLFPLATVVLHLVLAGSPRAPRDRGPRALREPGPWLALAVCGLTFLPWYVTQAIAAPDRFFAEHVRWLLWERAFVLEPEAKTAGSYFGYVVELARTYWPWLPFALVGAWLSARDVQRGPGADRDRALLLFVWFAVVVGTMSLATEKKLWYVMSAFPCLALLSARAASAWIRTDAARTRTIAWGFAFLAVLAAALNWTPLRAGLSRRPELTAMARVARTAVPAGTTVWNLDQDYWGTNNQFLYYSDRPLSEPVGDPARLREKLARGGFALLTRDGAGLVLGVAADEKTVRGKLHVVATAGPWVLVEADSFITVPPEL